VDHAVVNNKYNAAANTTAVGWARNNYYNIVIPIVIILRRGGKLRRYEGLPRLHNGLAFDPSRLRHRSDKILAVKMEIRAIRDRCANAVDRPHTEAVQTWKFIVGWTDGLT